MLRRPPRSTRTTHSFPTRRSSDLFPRLALGNFVGLRADAGLHLQVLRDQRGVRSLPRDDDIARLHPAARGIGNADVIRKIAEHVMALHSKGRVGWDRIMAAADGAGFRRSEEHTSELQSLMRISYAVFG